MSEEIKTITFLSAALICGIVAFAVSREAPEKTGADEVGNAFIEIENPREVARLKIVKFDAGAGKAEPFEVAKVDGKFSIPSHEDYPADQSDHLVDAVTSVSNLEILASVGDSAGTHEDYGVLDPSDETLGKGASGTGTRVTLTSADGNDLGDFIIGKEVEDADGQYYVRHVENDQVYTVQLEPDELSTKFEDWIERDLLKLDPLELKDVSINDYAVITEKQLVLGPTGLKPVNVVVDLEMKSAIDVAYDQKDLKWQLEKMVAFDRGAPKEDALAEDEELNKSTLDDFKSALDDLKIVDVHRKPTGLGSDLQEFIKANPKAAASLEERGFYFRTVQGPEGKRQNLLLSNNGEITVGMDDGVQYVLRFGNVAGAEKNEAGEDAGDADPEGEAASDEKEAAGDEDSEGESGKALRNLLVITEFNEDLIAPPEYEEVPPEQPPAEADDPPADDPPVDDPPADSDDANGASSQSNPDEQSPPPTDGQPGDEQPNDEQPGEGGDKDGAGASEDTPPAAAEDAEEAGSTCAEGDEDAGEESVVDEAASGDAQDPPSAVDGGSAEAGADGDATTPAEGTGDVDEADPEPEVDPQKAAEAANRALEEWKSKRDGIIKANERKKKAREEKIDAGKKRVEELNARFAAWYYVIPDETYRKIHLTRKDVVKKKEKTEEEKDGEDEKDSIEKFDDLKNALPPENE